ncbi:MAG TPA: hypothetical protein VLD61_10980 [Methylomirabilota bacterium]|nr:hypothetical protein [Methylomirabilota bacterium]
MDLTKLVAAALVGLILGVTLGYFLGGQENAKLKLEVSKVRAWLAEEMRQADLAREDGARKGTADVEQTRAALRQAQTALQQAQGELARTRAELARTTTTLREAQADWRAEVARRRALQDRVDALERQVQPRPPARTP